MLTNNTLFMNILDKMNGIKIQENEHKGEYIYSSEVHYCQRKTYYKLAGLRGFHSFASETRMAQGNIIHELLQSGFNEIVEELGYSRAISEVRSVTGIIHGRLDVMLISPHKKFIIEIKTVEKLPKVPYEHHISQLNLYLHNYVINAEKHGYEVKGILFYVSRYGKGELSFEIPYSEERFENDMKYATETLDFYKAKVLPPPTALYDKTNYWECKVCPFLLTCREDYNPLEESI